MLKRSRWKDYKEELYKDPNEPDYYDGGVNLLEPDTLESKVKWALGNIAINKASGCVEFQQNYSKP